MGHVWSLPSGYVWVMYEASDRADIWVMYGAYMKLNANGGFDDMKADYPVDY